MPTAAPLTGRNILVTGAAAGIGEAVARRCAADGAATALVDVSARVQIVAEEIGGLAYVGDVRDEAFADQTVQHVADRLGGLHGLANVAGVQRSGDAVTLDVELWDLTLGINVTAPFLWSRFAIPLMLEAGGGSIVNVASVAGTHAIRNSVAYVASKHALLGLTRSVATDFGRAGIRCNAVSPGSIETEFLRNYMDANPDAGRRLVDANFTGRLGQPHEVAACCSYLFGPDAGFINGANVAVDGGRTSAT